ncbi:MAG: primosomal protein N', partial [Candidatus Brocadiia bacterium]
MDKQAPAARSPDARIAVVALNLPLNRTFDYLVPEPMRGKVPVGGRVRVPFGKRKSVLGYCVELRQESSVPPDRLRPLGRSLDTEPLITPLMLELARWMSSYYRCSLGEAL